MNQLINKLTNQIPEEIIEYIISMIFDRRGYAVFEYNKRKEIDKPRMKLICKELHEFTFTGLSISWLKPCKAQRNNTKLFIESIKKGNPKIVFHIGYYTNNNFL